MDTQHVDAIMDHWACGKPPCPNERQFCVIVDGIYLRMIAQHMCTWSVAINDGDGDLETVLQHY